MLQRVARYVHKNHVVLVVARRRDPDSHWTAAYSVGGDGARYLPVLREASGPCKSHDEAVEQAKARARDYIDSQR